MSRQRRQPRPPKEMKDASANDLIHPNYLTPYHFDEKPVVVQIEKVFVEYVLNRQTNKEDEVNVFYFYNIDKGLKVPPSHIASVQRMFGDKISNWYGKFIRLIHMEEEYFGKPYYLTRVDENPVDQNKYQNQQPETNQGIPQAASENQLQQIEAFGSQLYGDEWQEKRSELSQRISKRTSDVTKLYESEAARMIRGITEKINSQPSEMPHDNEEGQEDSQQQIEGKEITF